MSVVVRTAKVVGLVLILGYTACNQTAMEKPASQAAVDRSPQATTQKSNPAPQTDSTAQQSAAPVPAVVDETTDIAPGIAVGEQVPDFSLLDHEGQERSLDDLLATGQLALVFHRSADW